MIPSETRDPEKHLLNVVEDRGYEGAEDEAERKMTFMMANDTESIRLERVIIKLLIAYQCVAEDKS